MRATMEQEPGGDPEVQLRLSRHEAIAVTAVLRHGGYPALAELIDPVLEEVRAKERTIRDAMQAVRDAMAAEVAEVAALRAAADG